MPEGQFSGGRAYYTYTSDSSEVYLILTDKTLGDLEGNGLVKATSANAGLGNLPRRFTPRGVYWQGELNGNIVRKFLVCNPTGSYYQTDSTTALTIDGIAGKITGRKGEQVSFPNFGDEAAAA